MASGFGAFGKFPGMGDFLRVGLPVGFVQAWDTWLQQGLVDIREQLSEAWTDAYMSAPIWRFTLPAGAAGEHAVSGILMASVDRVGRQYPLTLAACHDAPSTVVSHFANGAVFDQLENIALDALEDHSTRDSVTAALSAVHLVPTGQPIPARLPYAGPIPLSKALASEVMVRDHGPNPAIWSTMLRDDFRMRATTALPEGRDMRALFDLSPALWSASGVMAQV
ncbi:MAG: type VI secretion system-associated protein TagF [Pseudomonadota bacterium]